MTEEKEFVLELKDEELISLSDLHYNDEYRQETLEYKDKPSIVSDTMFKTMFQSEKRIKYAAYLISSLTNLSYQNLLKNMKLTTNELPKKYQRTKGQRSDFVASINGTYINIEVNNNKNARTYERNLAYLFKLYDQNMSGEEKYNSVIQVNINNFAYKESKEIIEIYCLRNKKVVTLTKKLIVVNIVLPNLLEKCYTKGVESLTEREKYYYALYEKNIKKLDKIMEEVPIVKEYVKEAMEVVENPIFGEAYDHEKANMEQSYEDGYEKGIEKGILEGEKKTKVDMIKTMYKNKLTIDVIATSTELSIKEVKEILEID